VRRPWRRTQGAGDDQCAAVFLLLGLALLAAPVAGLGQLSPPEGCTTFMTVQARGCRVSNHYRCEADQQGDQWRADFDQEGIYFVSRIDAEAQWVESFDLFPHRAPDAGPQPRGSRQLYRASGRGRQLFLWTVARQWRTQPGVRGPGWRAAMPKKPGLPPRKPSAWLAENGLYKAEDEHSSCGVGLVVSINGKPARKVVENGINALKAVWHRGAVDADGKTGDGAGIHVQIPVKFFYDRSAAPGTSPTCTS
jgi:hypothetical protein